MIWAETTATGQDGRVFRLAYLKSRIGGNPVAIYAGDKFLERCRSLHEALERIGASAPDQPLRFVPATN